MRRHQETHDEELEEEEEEVVLSEPVKSSGSEASLTPHKMIKPIKSSGSEASLTPITSDRSSGSGRSSEKGKQVCQLRF